MTGYTFTDEFDAINARASAARHKSLPVAGGDTIYWVNYEYSEADGFYYIQSVDGLEEVLGEPVEFVITEPDLES